MSIDSGDTLRLALNWTMPEQVDAYNILGLRCISGTCTEAEFLTACASWVNTAYQTLQSVIHNQVDLAAGTISEVTWSGTEWVVARLIGTILPTFAATNANQMLPHACSGVVVFPTATPKKRGRVNIPGLTEEAQSDSLLTAGTATALGNFATALRTSFNPGTAVMRYNVLGKGGVASTSEGFDVNGIIGSQRRRKPGVGI